MVRRGFVIVGVLGLWLTLGCGRSGGNQAQAETLDLADRAWSRGDTTQCRTLLLEILEGSADSFPARYRLALLRMEATPEVSLEELGALERMEPEHPGPPFYAGFARLRLSDYAGAERDFRRGYALALRRRGIPLEDTTDATRRGLALLDAGRASEAAGAFTQAVEADAENPTLWYFKARALANSGARDPALEAVNRALRMRPRFAAALALRAELSLAAQDLEAAREDLRVALEEEPELGWALYQRSRLFLAESEFRASALDLWHAILADPAIAQPHQALGQLFMRMDQGNLGMVHYQNFEWATAFLERQSGRLPGSR